MDEKEICSINDIIKLSNLFSVPKFSDYKFSFPSHIKLNNIDNLIAQAKALVSNIDMQYKVDIADNGWAEYITKEITNKNSESIFWDLM